MSSNPDKTKILLFSNTNIPDFNFTFDGRTIPITNSHKHLGVNLATMLNGIFIFKIFYYVFTNMFFES
jgi:hypothetical protein